MNASRRIPLSACIIAKNEADRIASCIQAVSGIVDEVIVVDSGSTDGTQEIARSLGAEVFHNDWTGYGPQKRFAEDRARNDWILNLDADEVVSPALAEEISALMELPPAFNAYRIKFRTVYPGQAAPRLWGDYHNYVRLYDRRVVRFRESPVHDTVDTRDESVGQLKGACAHFSARSFEHMKAKLDAYTDLQAKVLKKSALPLALRLPFEYPLVFLRYYIFRRHITGGTAGIRHAHICAKARLDRLVKFLKILRDQGQSGGVAEEASRHG